MFNKLANYINRAHLKFMAFCYRDYSSSEITDAINMYYEIATEMICAKSFDEIKIMFIDIEIFKKRFKGTIPPDMYEDRIERLKILLSEHTERVMHIKPKPVLMPKPNFSNQ